MSKRDLKSPEPDKPGDLDDLVLRTLIVYNTTPATRRREDLVKGLRFERLGNGHYYKVVLHIGSTYIPVSDDIVEELKAQSLLPAERFLELLVEKVGYSSYLKDQIRAELKSAGDPLTQVTVLQGAVRDL